MRPAPRFVLVVSASAALLLLACGGPPKSREDLGIHPEAEGTCLQADGKALLLSKYEGGMCGTTPVAVPPEQVPSCANLAVSLGCK